MCLFETFSDYFSLISFVEKKIKLKKDFYTIQYQFEDEQYELDQYAFQVWKNCGDKTKTHGKTINYVVFFLIFIYS